MFIILARILNSRGSQFANISENLVLANTSKSSVICNLSFLAIVTTYIFFFIFQDFIAFRLNRNKMLRSRKNQILLSFSFWPQLEPREGNNIYEMRTYTLKVNFHLF